MKGNKYSYLIRPLFLLVDILIINIVLYLVSDKNFQNLNFALYTTVSWVIVSVFTKYYSIYRTTHLLHLISLYIKQLLIFFLAFFTYFGLFKEGVVIDNQFVVIALIALDTLVFRIAIFYALKGYRIQGNNYRNVIILGHDEASQRLSSFFKLERKYGYRLFGFFSNDNQKTSEYLGSINDYKEYVLKNDIDEIYCSITSLSKQTIKDVRKFAKKQLLQVKLIPENTNIYSKSNVLQYYGTIPVLNPEKLPFEKTETHFIKRFFDILFSFLAIVFIMSWLVPILYLIIKAESKGPLFFKQKRTGLNGKDFFCYKFRSMKINEQSDQKSATKNDTRITKTGAFIRKTSIDELPQFFNVFLGDMSVVGPRPHMNSQTVDFEKSINNYMQRHLVKPGITGLAQVKGFRGEIKQKSDIENRVRLDIFYIENWSFLLDIKIVAQTVFNVFKGEEMAY